MSKKIKWLKNNDKITQTYSTGLEYAFASEDDVQVCPFVFCKDFLQDVVYAGVNHTPVDLYKFKYTPHLNGYPAFNKTKLLIANVYDFSFSLKIPVMLNFLNQVERHLNLPETIFYNCEREKSPSKYHGNIFLLEGSHYWMIAPPMISLYALLIRIGFIHRIPDKFQTTFLKIAIDEVRTYQRDDRKYVVRSLDGINAILKHGTSLFTNHSFYGKPATTDQIFRKNYPKKCSVKKIHDECGLMAFSAGVTMKRFPSWHQLRL